MHSLVLRERVLPNGWDAAISGAARRAARGDGCARSAADHRADRAAPGARRLRRSRLIGQLPGRKKLKTGSRLLVSRFPEIKFILSCCGVL